jgi:hypothetical protein
VLDLTAELEDLLSRVRDAAPPPMQDAASPPTGGGPYPLDCYRHALLSIEGRAVQKYWVGTIYSCRLSWDGKSATRAVPAIHSTAR